jgi:putative transposase
LRRHWFKPNGEGHVARHQFKKVVTLDAKRQAAQHLFAMHGVSDAVARQAIAKQSAERGRACEVLQVDRSTVRYQSVRADDGDLREAIKRVSRERRRFGYPLAGRRLRAIAVRCRIHVMTLREGHKVTIRNCGAFTLKKSCKSAAGVGANGPWAQEGRWFCPMVQTKDGASILAMGF